jgi:hypothetical protein
MHVRQKVMAAGSSSRFSCFLCDEGYVRADGLRRHYLTSHRLVWQHGRVSGASENELAARLEVLRHRQMSSRRRRRERASTRSEVTNDAERSYCRVAAMRGVDSVDSSPWPGDDDVTGVLSIPMLPDLAEVPTFASADVDCQTDPVVVLSAPPVSYDVEAQTEIVATESVGTATAPTALRWPSGVDYRAVIRLVRSRPDLSLDHLWAEVLRDFDVPADDRDAVKSAILGICWGLAHQAREVLGAVDRIMSDRDAGRSMINGLVADLREQADRHF